MAVTIDDGLANALVKYLQNGGTHVEGDALSGLLMHAAQEDARERAIQARIDAAVAEAKKPAPTTHVEDVAVLHAVNDIVSHAEGKREKRAS